MEMTQLIVTSLGAGGGALILVAIVNGIFKQISGASARERERNSGLEEQRVRAVEEKHAANQRADEEFTKRRIREKELAGRDILLARAGIATEDWIDLDRTISPDELRKLRDK